MKKNKVIISGGGTGGHIFPAIAIANALKRRRPDIEILFVGASGKMEMEKVPAAGYEIVGLPVMGFYRKPTLKNIKVLLNLYRSLGLAKKTLKTFAPDVVVGVGGYASGPVGRVALNKKIPLILQEQNSYAGVTNRILGRKAKKICVAYEGMERFFPEKNIVFTGNPIRRNLGDEIRDTEAAYAGYGLKSGCKTVLVTGGSLGAKTMNKAMLNVLETLGNKAGIQFIWQCGKYYYEDLKKELEGNMPSNLCLLPFIENMDTAYAISDVVVARAGAGTISELCALGKASILIPSPNVAEDHQTRNAESLTAKGAAIMIRDNEAESNLLAVLESLLSDGERINILSGNSRMLGIKDADDKIADVIFEYLEDGNVE